VALKRLRALFEEISEDARVSFEFDGHVMTIQAGEEVIAFPASGRAWAEIHRVPVRALRDFLPKRLLDRQVRFGIWEGCLEIGNRRFPDVTSEPKTTDRRQDLR
jgi:hypothetical protein